MDSSFYYWGRVDPYDVKKYLELCDIGLLSYVKNSSVSMPLKLYDYLDSGLAVLNSLKFEVSHIVDIKNIGINYIAGAPKSLADSINRLVENPQDLATMKQNSKIQSDIFSEDVQYVKLTKILTEKLQ